VRTPVQIPHHYHKMTAILNLAIVGMPIIVMALAIILMGEW
jgi:hypothetical protein